MFHALKSSQSKIIKDSIARENIKLTFLHIEQVQLPQGRILLEFVQRELLSQHSIVERFRPRYSRTVMLFDKEAHLIVDRMNIVSRTH